VPFVDLLPSHEGIRDRLIDEIGELVDCGAFTNGPHVAEFERAFARYCGVGTCVGVASGLDALRLGLHALGLEPGGEVIVPADTFAATFEAVLQAGGTPVPVDASERDYNVDVDAARAAIGPRTRGILPVHLYGQLTDMRAVAELARERGLWILEDACQAHGARRDGIGAGQAGDAAAFSFYPAKNLGAFGDAGALVTGDDVLAERVRALREHGQTAKYHHELVGYTSRLDTLQALVLLRKLPLLDAWNEARRAAARAYGESLAGIGDLALPPVPDGSEPVWHLYVVRTAAPERLAEFLRAHGIGTARHYPQPPHLAPAYRSLGYGRGAFPVAEALADECLSLPMFPGIADRQLELVITVVREFFGA